MADLVRKVPSKGGDPVAAQIARISDNPLINARQIDVEIEAGEPVRVPHGLGRPVRGYLCVYADQPIFGPFFEDLDAEVDRNTILSLEPAGNVETDRSINLSFLVW